MIEGNFEAKRGAYASLDSHYSELKPFFQTNLQETLENIVAGNTSTSNNGTLERLMQLKTRSQKASVKALLEEIDLREKLNLHLMQRIDEGISRQHTFSMQLNNQLDIYQVDRMNEINKQKKEFEQNVLELEKEKRKEYLECLRDLMFLKKYLLSALKEYWDTVKKQELLSDRLIGDFKKNQ